LSKRNRATSRRCGERVEQPVQVVLGGCAQRVGAAEQGLLGPVVEVGAPGVADPLFVEQDAQVVEGGVAAQLAGGRLGGGRVERGAGG
jgi:hypothetical protein